MEEGASELWRREAALAILAAAAERALRGLDVASASVSVWEREAGRLRTLVNVGLLGQGEQHLPAEEVYPVDTFPSLVRLLEQRTPYCLGHGDTIDVSSASLVASLGKDTQAAAPIARRSEVWGALWVATMPGGRPLIADDLPRVVRAANEIARALDEAAAA
jgi:hypothetical protein